MGRRIFRSSLNRLGPLCAAALLFALVGVPSALAGNVVANPGFETGNFAGWGGGGSFGAYADVTPTNARPGGVFSAVIGYPNRPANIDSNIYQYVVVPYYQPRLTYWIRPQCTSPAYDATRVIITNVSMGFSVVRNLECTTSSYWLPRSVDMSMFAGQLVQISFDVWSRGYGPTPTYTLLDDVSLS